MRGGSDRPERRRLASRGSDRILERLQHLHPKAIDLSLDRLQRLLTLLGHPERKLPPVVHIAGTNGKGSTLAMLDAMLQAAGRKVQRYISPHLVYFNERMLFNGVPIAEHELAEVLDICERVNAGAPITFFEITTAAAFLAFARSRADILLLETGLGGRLDATNVIERPRLTAITPISLDHQAFLGERIEQIAAEKAGILKRGVPCLVGPQRSSVAKVISARARKLEVPLSLNGRDWTVERTADERLRVTIGDEVLSLPLPVLQGRHQIDNAGLAVACARALPEFLPEVEAIAAGLRTARWPARLQRLTEGLLPALLPAGFELWLDGGHNPAAGEALAASLREDGDPRPWHLIVGMLQAKDDSGFLAPLALVARSVITVPVPDEKTSRDPRTGAATARRLGLAARAAPEVETALRLILADQHEPCRVLICGSLYLAGHVLRDNS
jgi:dihydrofolate synthase/folylpolyglutamate synthase